MKIVYYDNIERYKDDSFAYSMDKPISKSACILSLYRLQPLGLSNWKTQRSYINGFLTGVFKSYNNLEINSGVCDSEPTFKGGTSFLIAMMVSGIIMGPIIKWYHLLLLPNNFCYHLHKSGKHPDFMQIDGKNKLVKIYDAKGSLMRRKDGRVVNQPMQKGCDQVKNLYAVTGPNNIHFDIQRYVIGAGLDMKNQIVAHFVDPIEHTSKISIGIYPNVLLILQHKLILETILNKEKTIVEKKIRGKTEKYIRVPLGVDNEYLFMLKVQYDKEIVLLVKILRTIRLTSIQRREMDTSDKPKEVDFNKLQDYYTSFNSTAQAILDEFKKWDDFYSDYKNADIIGLKKRVQFKRWKELGLKDFEMTLWKRLETSASKINDEIREEAIVPSNEDIAAAYRKYQKAVLENEITAAAYRKYQKAVSENEITAAAYRKYIEKKYLTGEMYDGIYCAIQN